MLVVVATDAARATAAAGALRRQGASQLADKAVGGARVLVYGGPFDDPRAVAVGAHLRSLGWAADVRPEGGGHLAAWHAHTRPVEVGRLRVCFPWSEFDRDKAGPVVEIDPGGAFGTGAHPTTRLLLCELAGRLQGGEAVLDVGCGSGVLAITAAALGARATAIDIEPAAIEATRSNAARNNLGKRVHAAPTPVEELLGRFDVIVANIHADGLVQLAPGILRLMNPGAWLGLSGLSPAQSSVVEAAYRDRRVIATRRDDDWTALVLR